MKSYYCVPAGGLKKRDRQAAPALILKAIATMGMLVFFSLLPGFVAAAGADSPRPSHAETALKSAADLAKEVVARVNGVEITRKDVQEKMVQMRATAAREATAGQSGPDTLRKEALHKLILQELAYQRAKAVGITIPESQLDDAIAEIKANIGGEEKYREGLRKRQMTEEVLRRKLQRNLMVKRIFEKEVPGKVVISEEQLRKEYENVKNDFSMPEKVVIDDVVLFLPLEEDNSVKIAGNLLRKIQEDPGKDPWNIPSDGSFAVREREITKDKQPELYAEARKLKEGQVSGVLRTSDSFHIIRLKKYTPAVEAQFAQLRDRIERRLRALAQQKKMEQWENELKKGAAIEIMPEAEKE
jgi:parvulin-like peptidyl-prolyl isomerase